jgi:hypothetical protein
LAAEVMVVPTQPRLFEGSAFAETLRLVQGTSILRPQLRVRLALNRGASSRPARPPERLPTTTGVAASGRPFLAWGNRRTASPHASTTGRGRA